MRTLLIVSAGLSRPSSTHALAARIADATTEAAAFHGQEIQVKSLELREIAVDIAEHMTNGFNPSDALRAAHDDINAADGLIAASPIFSASYSGLFKMFFDSLPRTLLHDTPTLLAATAGSARHLLAVDYALRPLLTHLKASVVPTAVFFSTSQPDYPPELIARIERAAAELAGAMLQLHAVCHPGAGQEADE